MKIFITTALLFSSLEILGAPCDGAPGRYHMNPDGTHGGFIQRTAQVSKETHIDTSSEICDKAIIRGRVQIHGHTKIRDNVVIEGSATIQDSHLYESAKIAGRAIIQNSEVCQSSSVEGIKVINSNYYCQTEDPQPKDPGEDNFKTLLGIDSDGDGVRDDVERFINLHIPNTPRKNRAQERIASKLFAKILQKELLLRMNKEKLKLLYTERNNLIQCHGITLNDDIFLEMYDTQDRILALTKIAGATHGDEPQEFNKNKCKSIHSLRGFINNI